MDYCLLEIEKGIRRIDSGPGLADLLAPSTGAQERLQHGNPLINEEQGYERERMQQILEMKLNEGQAEAVGRILASVKGEPQVFFLQVRVDRGRRL
jgi:hypothetical protein